MHLLAPVLNDIILRSQPSAILGARVCRPFQKLSPCLLSDPCRDGSEITLHRSLIGISDPDGANASCFKLQQQLGIARASHGPCHSICSPALQFGRCCVWKAGCKCVARTQRLEGCIPRALRDNTIRDIQHYCILNPRVGSFCLCRASDREQQEHAGNCEEGVPHSWFYS